MKKYALALLLQLMLASVVHASQWVTIYKWDDYELLYDAESLIVDKQNKNVWSKIISANPKLLYPDSFRGESFDTTVEDLTINCKLKEMKINQTALYLGKVSVNSPQPVSRWYRPIPDSMHDYVLKHICRL